MLDAGQIRVCSVVHRLAGGTEVIRGDSNLLGADGADLRRRLRFRRIDNDVYLAPTGIRVRALPLAKPQGLELRVIKGEIGDEVVADDHSARLSQDHGLLRISRRSGNDDNGDAKLRIGQELAGRAQ